MIADTKTNPRELVETLIAIQRKRLQFYSVPKEHSEPWEIEDMRDTIIASLTQLAQILTDLDIKGYS